MVDFQEWKKARSELLSAINNYINTTAVLEALFAKSRSHFSNDIELENAISSICSEHPVFVSRTHDLLASEVHVNKIRNQSKRLVLINLLPLEIMTRIFTLACGSGCSAESALTIFDRPVRGTHETLLALSQACTDWRRIVTGIPDLWSHIDIASCSNDIDSRNILDNTHLWLERSQNRPLLVHISAAAKTHESCWDKCTKVFPHLNSATSLCIGPDKRNDFFVKMLSCWIKLTKPGQVQTLACLGTIGACISLDDSHELPPGEASDKFLLPIRVLRLHDAYFAWDSLVYHGLVELHIGYLVDVACPTAKQMVGILSACPELRVLRLQVMTFWNHDQEYCEPVSLKYLEMLDLAGLRPDGLAVLLPILAPGSGELSLRFSQALNPQDELALAAFFGRSNIVRLFLQGEGWRHPHSFAHIAPLKNLRVLIFDLNFDSEPSRGNEKLEALIDPSGRDSFVRCTPRWPQLGTIHLINGQIYKDTVRSVAESFRIQKLRIESCYMDGSNQEVEQGLQRVVRDVRCRLGLGRRVLIRDWYKLLW